MKTLHIAFNNNDGIRHDIFLPLEAWIRDYYFKCDYTSEDDRPLLIAEYGDTPLPCHTISDIANAFDWWGIYRAYPAKSSSSSSFEKWLKENGYVDVMEKSAANYMSQGCPGYDNVIRCFCGALGFWDTSLERYTACSILYEFAPDLKYHSDDGNSGKWILAEKLAGIFPLIASDDTAWDILRDTYHAQLLPTDGNKEKILALFKKAFPDATVQGFSSGANDYGSYSMSFSVEIPFTDIEALYRRVMGK